ncbi:hypothetical protein [Helicobacter sp. T3_23-1056]
MAKILLLCVMIGAIYGESIFQRVAEFDSSAGQSFDCQKAKFHTIEAYLCNKQYITQNEHNQYQDSFFTSYYNLIMRYIAKDKKPSVKNIAKKAMKKRDDLLPQIAQTAKDDAQRYANRFDPNSEPYPSTPDNAQNANQVQIEIAYFEGARNLTKFLLENDTELFAKIFPKNTGKYKAMLTKILPNNVNSYMDSYDEIWGDLLQSLYDDDLIDKNGAIVGDSHNDSRESSENLNKGSKKKCKYF